MDSRHPLSRVRVVEHVLVAGACAIAGSAFRGLYVDWRFMVPVVVATVLPTLVTVAGRRLGWPVPVSLLGSLVVLVVVGCGLIENGVPPGAAPDFVRTAVEAWRRALDVAPPIGTTGRELAVPFLATWAGAALGAELTARLRQTAAPLVAPAAVLAVAILYGVQTQLTSTVVGTALFAVSVLLVMVRGGARSAPDGFGTRSPVGASLPGAAVAIVGLAVAAIAAPAAAERLPFAATGERTNLREDHRPTFDPRSLASPLSAVGSHLEPELEGEELFVLSGAIPDRIRLAALSAYDGSVWGLRSLVDSAFLVVSSALPAAEGRPNRELTLETTVTVIRPDGLWLPSPGIAVNARTDDEVRQSDLRFDRGDGNLLSARPLGTGDSVTVTALEVSEYRPGGSDDEPIALAEPPPGVAEFVPAAGAIASSELLPRERLDALIGWFAQNGYFDKEALPGHHAVRLADFLRTDDGGVSGHEEQYAAAFAALAGAMGLRARVVVGYELGDGADDERRVTVTTGDLRAWNEVLFEQAGWMTIDVTPDENRVRTEELQETSAPGAAQLPVAPLSEPEAELEDDADRPEDDKAENELPSAVGGSWGVAELVAAGGIGVLAVLGAMLASIVGLKWARRRRRRRRPAPADRIAGVWEELIDRHVDRGYEPVPGSTLRRQAVRLAAYDAVEPGELAVLIDGLERSAFSAEAPTAAAADDLWAEFDRFEMVVTRPLTRYQRIRAGVRVRSLRQPAGTRWPRRGPQQRVSDPDEAARTTAVA